MFWSDSTGRKLTVAILLWFMMVGLKVLHNVLVVFITEDAETGNC